LKASGLGREKTALQIKNFPSLAIILPFALRVTLATRASKWNLLLFLPRP